MKHPQVTTSPHRATTQAEEVAAALAGAAGRTAQLLRSGLDPAALVPGLTWTAAETAAHLVADLNEHTAILTRTYHAQGTPGGPGDRRNPAERGAAANRAQLDAFPERDLIVLAGLIEEARPLSTSRSPPTRAGDP